jgi:catechol 2,3-dioxygenase-like lactoylglutathione lyase family enzyme
MLAHGEVHVDAPAADLQRARHFYVDRLGLTPVTEDEQSVRFVKFEHYAMPGVTWDGDIAEVGGQRVACFTDSGGNVMCLDERRTG